MTELPQGEAPPAMAPGSESATRFVAYDYCYSIIVLTYRHRRIVALAPGQSRFVAGLRYSAFTAVAGWWGIPWGPLFSVYAIYRNTRGGTDVTDEVLHPERHLPPIQGSPDGWR